MINISTVSDSEYLTKGLTLFESLIKTTKNFRLHYFAIDDLTYERLSAIQDDRIVAYNYRDFTSQDETLRKLLLNDYKYFCWSLASYFSNSLINCLNVPITYIDSDIYFHHDLNIVLEAIGDKEVGIFRHRQFNKHISHPSGWFNVGVVHFKNTHIGKQTLNWWSDAVLNKKYPHLHGCGDQKYLDEFIRLPTDKLFIDGDIGHGAPWQWQLYDMSSYKNDGCIKWGDKVQKLIFTHFSQFEYDLEQNTYIPSTMHHCYTPLSMYTNGQLKSIYDNYFEEIKRTIKQYA